MIARVLKLIRCSSSPVGGGGGGGGGGCGMVRSKSCNLAMGWLQFSHGLACLFCRW